MRSERTESAGGPAAGGATQSLLIGLVTIGTLLSACTSGDISPRADASPSTSVAATTPTRPTPVDDLDELDEPDEPVLTTPCLVTGPGLVLPQDDWIAADVSSGGGDCLFVLQQEGLADTTVIAGELFLSSAGRTFDEFVEQLEDDLTVGQEPDILGLQLLNTGASGRNLAVLERIEIDDPNRAVILIHESDRRDGYTALSAIVDVPTESAGTDTHAIKLWGLLAPPGLGSPDDSPNYQLAIDLIDSMVIRPQ